MGEITGKILAKLTRRTGANPIASSLSAKRARRESSSAPARSTSSRTPERSEASLKGKNDSGSLIAEKDFVGSEDPPPVSIIPEPPPAPEDGRTWTESAVQTHHDHQTLRPNENPALASVDHKTSDTMEHPVVPDSPFGGRDGHVKELTPTTALSDCLGQQPDRAVNPATAPATPAVPSPRPTLRPRTQSLLPAGLHNQLLHTLLGGVTATESDTDEVLLRIPTKNIESQLVSLLGGNSSAGEHDGNSRLSLSRDGPDASTDHNDGITSKTINGYTYITSRHAGSGEATTTTMPNRRKVWVRRPGGSATLVSYMDDDVVDDVRDTVLRKYANSLGRQFDAPDLTLRILPREPQRERPLAPDEPIARLVDAYYPGGQRAEEALVIDAPLRRTPKASPRTGPPHAPHVASVYFTAPTDEGTTAVSGGRHQPVESGTDYFGPAAAAAIAAAAASGTGATVHLSNGAGAHPHSIGVLTTGQIPQIPQLPSPGGSRTRPYRERPDRPRLGRQHTSSPTILNLVNNAHPTGPLTVAGPHIHPDSTIAPPPPPAPPILPTPPPPNSDAAATIQRVATPPPAGAVPARVSSPRPSSSRPKKSKKSSTAEHATSAAGAAPPTKSPSPHPQMPPGILSGGVPCINVLIVEDNPINLRLLEVFVKRLKVRWQTAVNGREALDKWRLGGFHLVLMDIQLPVMSGLDATREIRRLERINSIGVFSSSASSAPEEIPAEPAEEDKLANRDLFKSPVIIVALTASSLQSDRRDALAAGCNDFLTKPVNFVWFEKKIREWGCMQALIDFDGWQHWNELSQHGAEGQDAAAKKTAAKAKSSKKNRSSLSNITSGSSA